MLLSGCLTKRARMQGRFDKDFEDVAHVSVFQPVYARV